MADTRRVMNCQLGSLAAAAAAGWDRQLSWFYREAKHTNTITSVSSYTMCDRSYASFTSDSSHKLESRPQCFCMGENFTTIQSFHIYWAKKKLMFNQPPYSILHFHCMKKEAPVDTRARTRPGGCNMSDDSISECTSQLWSSPGRVLLMVLAATISARLLLAAGHPQYCLLCRGQHFGHRYCDEYTFYCVESLINECLNKPSYI